MDEPKQFLADLEIERMRLGPRPARTSSPALFAEMWELLHEASDLRRTSIFGIETMRQAVALKAHLLGRCSSPPPEGEPAMAAAAERAAMAEAASAHDHAHLNAMTLVSMFGAIQGMVEGVGPDLHRYLEEELAARLGSLEGRLDGLRSLPQVKDSSESAVAYEELRPAVLRAFETTFREDWPTVRESLAPLPPVARWEDALGLVRLGAPGGRPLPVDLVATLDELGAVRNALLHRRGRVDTKLRKQAPKFTKDMAEESLIRVRGDHYRLFVAAIWTYAEEIGVRAGMGDPFPLDVWRDNYTVCD